MDMDVDLELKIKILQREFQLPLLHQFRLGLKATSKICGTMSQDVLSVPTTQHCFHWFKNRSFELVDLPHIGRSLKVDVDLLKQLIEEDLRLTTRCLAEQLKCSYIAVKIYLHELSKTWKYGVWHCPWIISTSSATQGWCLYGIIDSLSQLPLAPQSH